MIPQFSVLRNCIVGPETKLIGWLNAYDARIGAGCLIGPFVELGGCIIGDRTTIGSHCYVPPHVEIGNDCFIAHGVMFTNDLFETPARYEHISELKAQWTPRRTVVGNNVRIGSGACILPVKIGDGAVIGAGAVVTRDVAPGWTVVGVPARQAVGATPKPDAFV